MTAIAGTAPFAERRPELLRSPPQGWGSLVLLGLMLLIVALAIDDGLWAGYGAAGQSQTDFLAPAILLAAVWGYVSARSRLPPFAAHLVGASLGVAFLFLAVGGVLTPSERVEDRLDALLASLGRFYEDLVVNGIRSAETSAFLLSLGAIVWATGQFAAFTVFRRNRPLNAVFLVGFVLLTEVSVTLESQYLYLAAFCALALFFVVRLNLVEQQSGWERRGIVDRGDVSSLYMRSAGTFVVVAILASIFLAANASSAPLSTAWRDADNGLVHWGQQLNHVLGGVTGAARGPSGLFGTSQTIRGVWESSSSVVFRFASEDGRETYWRGASYDAFDGTTWLQLDRGSGTRVDPGGALLEGTPEEVDPTLPAEPVSYQVTAYELGNVLLTPETPSSASVPADVYTHGEGGPVAAIELAEFVPSGASYEVAGLARPEDEARGALTENQLAAAGTDYPAWTERYIDIQEGSLGDRTHQVASQIVAALPNDERDPYHVADAVQRFLYRTGGFEYRTDVRGLCRREGLVDCFLRTRVGYCEHFATAMVMLLRTQEIPARIVMGYLPGQQLSDGSWEVDRSAAHAWVEVYFPSYGWVRFDPTPGNRENGQRPTELEAGAPVATAEPTQEETPTAAASVVSGNEALSELERRQLRGGGGVGGGAQGGLPLAAIVALALAFAAVVLLLLTRMRRAATEPEALYRGIERLASRFGYGPRPAQTAYEYAGALGDLVPRVRDDLQAVAHARVEARYGRRPPAQDLLVALAGAYRRIRIGLMRLAVRRTRPRSQSPR